MLVVVLEKSCLPSLGIKGLGGYNQGSLSMKGFTGGGGRSVGPAVPKKLEEEHGKIGTVNSHLELVEQCKFSPSF